ncbi:hypothetical protein E2C01_033996 [Portunus trituberculatus]|uniref:Uncharacterized protein n=1 Tax=Portunus trituberculatus TaxID=210409 RepID=A0A5B7F576_PORTR|nr:hypothetical protein [Portunus trituberculatus]
MNRKKCHGTEEVNTKRIQFFFMTHT